MGLFGKKEDKITVEQLHNQHKGFKSALDAAVKSKHKMQKPKDDEVVYVVEFKGNITAKQVQNLRHEITAILLHAKPKSEVIVVLDSPGGTVTGYGLVSSQIKRLRDGDLDITVVVDEMAASGGYMAAVVGHRIVAAKTATIGSIGVLVTMPNATDFLSKYGLAINDYSAGEHKRTVVPYAHPNDDQKKHLKDKLETVHREFKSHISTYRPSLDMGKVGTGETWSGAEALDLGLIDEIGISDDLIFDRVSSGKKVLKVKYEKYEKKKKDLLKTLLTYEYIEGLYDVVVEKIADTLHNKTMRY